jgi:hypothetical protein
LEAQELREKIILEVYCRIGSLEDYTLKSTTSGKGLFLTSFRKTRQKPINKLREKGKLNKIKKY